MLEIDGSQKSGSGTILRMSIALAAILQEPLHIYNIRHKRRQPGLRPQHLESVTTAAKLCNAETKGVKLGSRELWFTPSGIVSREVKAEIGTAGSIPMLLMTVLPICAYAKRDISIRVVNGGTDVRYSPTINYLKYVLLPALGKMGLKANLTVKRYGYYPKGMGEVLLKVTPISDFCLINLPEFGEITEISGISVCTFLERQKVAERQANTASKFLLNRGYKSQIQMINDMSNPAQKGSSIVLWAKTDKAVLLGGDAIGELGKTSEAVGREAAENLWKEIAAKATVDIHLADMLVPYMGLARGASSYLTRHVTDHLETNIWLTEKILDAKFQISEEENLYKIEKL